MTEPDDYPMLADPLGSGPERDGVVSGCVLAMLGGSALLALAALIWSSFA